MLDERSVLPASAPLNVFKNKGNVKTMLNESKVNIGEWL